MTLFTVSEGTATILDSTSFAFRHNEAWIQELADETPHFVNDGQPMVSLGREIATVHGHYIDNLFLDGNGTIVVAEMKRQQTPRNVVAQVLDYAAQASRYDWEDLDVLCKARHGGRSLVEVYQQTFGQSLETNDKPDHRLLVVAETVDPLVADAALYLLNTGVPIALLEFSLMDVGHTELYEVRTVLGEIPGQSLKHRTTSASEGWPEEGYINWLLGSVANVLPEIAERQGWPLHFKVNKQSLPFVSGNWPRSLGDCQLRIDVFRKGKLSFRFAARKDTMPIACPRGIMVALPIAGPPLRLLATRA